MLRLIGQLTADTKALKQSVIEHALEIEKLQRSIELILMTVGAGDLASKKDICEEVSRLGHEAIKKD